MAQFASRVVVVTGGAQGIGFGVAAELLRRGAKVVLVDVDARKLHDARLSLISSNRGCGDVMVESVDVTDASAVDVATKRIFNVHGRIDVLVQVSTPLILAVWCVPFDFRLFTSCLFCRRQVLRE